jgi:putative membrane protein
MTGVAWYVLVPRQPGRDMPLFVWARLVRLAASEVLPLSQIGGPVAGVRVAILHGVPGPMATASTIVDVSLEFIAQLAYALLGLAILVAWQPGTKLALPVLGGLVVTAGLAAGFIWLQRQGTDGLLDRLARLLADRWLTTSSDSIDALHSALATIHGRRGRVALSFLLHFAEWLGTGIEAWVALRLIHAPLDLIAVLGVEGLLHAVRAMAFAIPNAAGVQEGAYILLGAAFGLPPDHALALSLLKRARDLALGIPSLIAWQALEGERAWNRRRAPQGAAAAGRKR